MASSITLKRDSGWNDRIRAYRVMLDDREIGRIKNGATATYEVAPGRHTLRCQVDWCGSRPVQFDVADGGKANFDVASNLRGLRMFLAGFYVLFLRSEYLKLRQTS